MPRKRYNLNLPEDLYERARAQAGDVPMSRFVERALEAALGVGAERSVEAAPASPRASEPVSVTKTLNLRPGHCPDHPEAGTTEVNGKVYCAEPGCPRLIRS